jgi:transcriptional regulator with XRE-family HTH domain
MMKSERTNNLIFGFWDRFDEACKQSGMTKAEISRRMGVDRKTLYNPHDSRSMNSGYLAKFCGVTGVSADYLLGLSNTNKERKVTTL